MNMYAIVHVLVRYSGDKISLSKMVKTSFDVSMEGSGFNRRIDRISNGGRDDSNRQLN